MSEPTQEDVRRAKLARMIVDALEAADSALSDDGKVDLRKMLDALHQIKSAARAAREAMKSGLI